MQCIKISFNSYENMPFIEWLKFGNSGQGIINYFVKVPFESLVDYEQSVVIDWLGFLTKEIELDKIQPIDLYEKSIAQKIDALAILRKNENNIVQSFPMLISIFEQVDYDYKKNIELSNEIQNKSVKFVLENGQMYLEGLGKIETSLQKSFKPLKLKTEFVQAGYKDFQKRFNDYILIDTLANGNILEYDNVSKLSIEDVHANLIFKNAKAYHEQRLNEIYEQKLKEKR